MKHILLLSSLLGSFMGQQHLLVEGSSSSTLPKSLASLHHLHPDVFRGGGTAVAEKNKTNKKKKKKKRKLKSLKTVTETVTEFETVTEDEDTAELPTVESILIDRRVNIRKVISSLSLGCAMLCLMTGCIPTAGNPYRHAVWEALHEGNMPTDYLPTVLDVLLTKHKVSLPPQYLPSPAPLLSLLASLAVFIGVAILLPKWSLPVKLFFHYVQTDADHLDQLDDMDTASVLIKVPKDQRIFSQGKSRIISPLFREQKGGQHFFHLNHVRYYWDGQQVTHGGPTIHKWAIASILGWKGLNSMSKIKEAKQKYAPYNSIISELPCPTIRQALATRLSSPLAVFQFASKMLQIVEGDSSLFHSMGSIFATLGQHYWNARQTITSAKELATEVTAQIQDTAQLQVFCQRERKKGKFISAIDLLPGDIFYLEKQTITTMPVDAVLLDGACIAMEAVLTGESVPQSKMCLQNSTTEEHFDMNGEHRSSVLFAGTTVQLGGKIKCLAIKTGSYSSRGDIWRVLQKSQKVGAISNPQVERDGVKLLLALTAACIMSCAWFLSNASEDTSNFRKVLQCTRIASSSIPSDLPLALSSVAQSCAARLKADGEVVCGEPGSLLTAASVDCVVFDKTGTLTADTQSMSQIVSYQNSQKKTARIVLAGCHALVRSTQADERWIGDPLDSASFLFSGWRYDKKDGSFCDKQQRRLWQLKTFPFDANRKLSSALVLVQQGKEYSLMYVVKGSSETVQRNFLRRKNRKFQTWYQGQLTELGKDGVRTVAMVAKTVEVTNSSLCEALLPTGAEQNITAHLRKAKKLAKKLVSRDDIESDSATGWKFCGFACFDATVRPSTPRIIRELQTANIQTMMLTGDGVDAAISVAKRSNILPQTKTVATLDCDDQGELVWKEDGRKTTCSSGSVLRDRSLSLAMTGNAAEKLLAGRHSDENARYILSKIHKIVVFARCSPKQKKMIVGALREYGKKKVLMCGKYRSISLDMMVRSTILC